MVSIAWFMGKKAPLSSPWLAGVGLSCILLQPPPQAQSHT
jgi:hypothetical protein